MFPIEIKNLSKTFRGKKGRKIEALMGLSLEVSQGEVFGFLGPNGAGKSTTIKTLMGQITPSSGSSLLFGLDSSDPVARKRVGYLPENPAFYDFMTAREYLGLVGKINGMSAEAIQSSSNRVLDAMSLSDAASRPIRGYSKGMVQRLGIAQTLLHDPDVFILDEPMSGLDPVGRALVKQIMVELKNRGKTIFFSTHVIADVEAVCDRVGIVAQGTLRAVYDVGQVLQSGIEGYLVQIKGHPEEALAEEEYKDLGGGRFEVSVPRDDLQAFMEKVFSGGGQLEIIEPKRRSLESLFLEVIDRKP